jgi:hypothetical protein
MLNPNTAIWVVVGALCGLPMLAFLAGLFLGTAFAKGWFTFRVDPAKAPRLRIGRNG